MGTVVFIIGITIILFFLLGKNNVKKSSSNKFNKNEIGMYNMNLHKQFNKEYKNTGKEVFYYLSSYNELIALACQGRIEELDEVFNNELKDDRFDIKYIEFVKSKKKILYSMAKIVRKLDESNMLDMKVGESVGEYIDRKLLKRKKFMEYYTELNNYDIRAFYGNEIKKYEKIIN